MNYNEDEAWYSYFYPNSNTLINKLGITDYKELKQKEAEISFEKLVELYENPIEGNFDAEHLKKIHKYIFGDIYDWAGEYRYVDMQKETGFANHQVISNHLDYELNLMNESAKNITSKSSMAMFLADYYTQIMAIHPFREGNGRSCREFLREFVEKNNSNLLDGELELNWTNFDNNVMLDNISFALAFRGPIEHEFYKALEPKNKTNEEENKPIKK